MSRSGWSSGSPVNGLLDCSWPPGSGPPAAQLPGAHPDNTQARCPSGAFSWMCKRYLPRRKLDWNHLFSHDVHVRYAH